eukprot:6024635-Prymnesium_polylepis.2
MRHVGKCRFEKDEAEDGAASMAEDMQAAPQQPVAFSSWAQCDECQRWRRLPADVLPPGEIDPWECSSIGLVCEDAQEALDAGESEQERAGEAFVTSVLSHHVYATARPGSLFNVYARVGFSDGTSSGKFDEAASNVDRLALYDSHTPTRQVLIRLQARSLLSCMPRRTRAPSSASMSALRRRRNHCRPRTRNQM